MLLGLLLLAGGAFGVVDDVAGGVAEWQPTGIDGFPDGFAIGGQQPAGDCLGRVAFLKQCQLLVASGFDCLGLVELGQVADERINQRGLLNLGELGAGVLAMRSR